MSLNGKVAVVTGAGAGMGRAVAMRYAREGCRVVIADINRELGEATAAAIASAGGEGLAVATDVSQAAQVEALAAHAVAAFGRIDILYSNAGIELFGGDGRAHELTEAAWERTIGVNLRGMWLCAKYVLPVMLQQGSGVIINVASPTGLRAEPGETAYSTSKGGVIALTRTMAADYARDGIRVNAIVPGFMDTPLVQPVLNAAVRAAAEARIPAGRLGLADEVAGMAVFLASDEARYCIGGLYLVDGGYLAV